MVATKLGALKLDDNREDATYKEAYLCANVKGEGAIGTCRSDEDGDADPGMVASPSPPPSSVVRGPAGQVTAEGE